MYDFNFEHTDDDGDQIYLRGYEHHPALIASVYGDNDEVALGIKEVTELHAMLGAFIERFKPRDYTVGLPVTIKVHPSGQVEYEVDTSEAAMAVDELKYEHEEGKSQDDLDRDVQYIEMDHRKRHAN